jgi:hypothetical protein
MPTATSSTGTQRATALALLVVAGVLSLPVVAAFLDGESTENLVVPVQLVLMAVVGAIVGYLLPGLAGVGANSSRGAVVGAVVGVVMALVGIAVFALLL